MAANGPTVEGKETAKVRFLRPQLPALTDIAVYYELAERARFYSNGGPCEQLLRTRLSSYLGGMHCVPVNNATTGIIAALRALTDLHGTGTRPLVVTPSYTFAATAGAIAVLGFRPTFVDVDADSWQLDADALERVLGERDGEVAAVLATHTFGVPPAPAVQARWADICERRSVPLVVDAAAGFGAVNVDDARSGAQGGTHVFSFHATKPFGIGEGGLIVTSDSEVSRYCDAFRQFGFDRGRVATLAGINGKMDELHAATALTVLDGYEDILAIRRGIGERYRRELEPHGFTFQAEAAGGTWQAGYLQAPDALTRDAILAAGPAAGIEVKAYYDVPLHRQPAFADAGSDADLPTTDRLAAHALSLPMANDLSDDEIDRVLSFVIATAAVARAER